MPQKPTKSFIFQSTLRSVRMSLMMNVSQCNKYILLTNTLSNRIICPIMMMSSGGTGLPPHTCISNPLANLGAENSCRYEQSSFPGQVRAKKRTSTDRFWKLPLALLLNSSMKRFRSKESLTKRLRTLLYQDICCFEIIVDCLPWREILRKHPPLAACLVGVKNRVHNLPKRMSSAPLLRINDFFNNLSLIISEVG